MNSHPLPQRPMRNTGRLVWRRCSALLGCLPIVAAADSGAGLATAREHSLSAVLGPVAADARGTSWLRPGQRRTPSGHLYVCPAEPDYRAHADWQYAAHLQLGYLASFGDDDNALWRRYTDWHDGLVLGLLHVALQRPDDGSYARVRASRLSDDDAFIEAAFGRAGSYRVQAYLRESPNVLSSNAKPIWSGIGSNQLSLLPTLTPGASSSAEVAAVSAAAPARVLAVTRSKQGIAVNASLNSRWSVHAALNDEQRRGTRPFGGSFFYNFIFPENAGVLETVRPVDDSTLALRAGLRYAGARWRLDLSYDGSFYRDRYTRLNFESPFALTPILPGATSAPIFQGQFALEPDNTQHNLRTTATRRLPWNGELALTVVAGRLSQNDSLIAPLRCSGVFGVDINGSGQPGADNPYLYSCADWNTPASLSRQRAGLRIDTGLFDARFALQPLTRVSLVGGVRVYREDYRSTYLAYNPLTGDYGYIAENGSQASLLPGVTGTWNALSAPSAITRVRSLPLDRQTTTANLGGDWRLAAHTRLGLAFDWERREPEQRERQRVDSERFSASVTNRHFDGLTLRAQYKQLRQDGDSYVADPYDFLYSSSLPGFIAPAEGVPAHTVDALRKYDLADRRQHSSNLIATVMPRADMTLSLNLRAERNAYAAEIGRQRYDTRGVNLQWEWQPAPTTRVSSYAGRDVAMLDMASVADVNSGPDATLGGDNYPESARWWADDRQRNRSFGASAEQRIGRVRVDLSWSALQARGDTRYRFATPSALAYFADGIGRRGGEFPAMSYRLDSAMLGLSVPLAAGTTLRLFERFERVRLADWHYSGLDTARVFDHRVYTDGGPRGYRTNLLGVFLDMKL